MACLQKPFRRPSVQISPNMATFVQEGTILITRCDPLNIRSSSTVDVIGVWFFSACFMDLHDVSMVLSVCVIGVRSFSACFMVLHDVSMVLSVCVYSSCYCGVFQALFFESCGCSLIFPQHFPTITRGPVLFSGAYLHS